MYYLTSKDNKKRFLLKKIETRLLINKFLFRNVLISTSDKQKILFLNNSFLKRSIRFTVAAKNRCLFTNRSGSIIRYFRLSRIMTKQLASRGLLPGIRKSS